MLNEIFNAILNRLEDELSDLFDEEEIEEVEINNIEILDLFTDFLLALQEARTKHLVHLKSINEWRLGYDFYKDYVSYFNYDKGEITLFRDKPFAQSNYLLVIIIFTIIVNILGLLNTAYYYIGYNKVYF